MKILETEALCYDDVLLVPQYSDLDSRQEADIGSSLTFDMQLKVPVISANMDSITEPAMAKAMHGAGGSGILHRYATLETVLAWMAELESIGIRGVPSVGVHSEDIRRAEIIADKYPMIVCVDIAHADSKHAVEMTKRVERLFRYVVVGNVATYDGTSRLVDAGGDIIKVGVGPGSVCTTRIVTGHGYPQFSAVLDCAKIKKVIPHVRIVADGGIRNSGDAAKALGAGADLVMVGGMLAGTDETPLIGGKHVLRGMASAEAQTAYRGHVSNDAPEGAVYRPEAKGPVGNIIKELAGGIRSAFSYTGARSLTDFQEKAIFVRVSPNTVLENGPHALYGRK